MLAPEIDKMIKDCGYKFNIVGGVLDIFDSDGNDVCKVRKGDYMIEVNGTIAVTSKIKDA